MYKDSIFVFLELELVCLSIGDHDRGHGAPVWETACVVHDLVHDVRGAERLAGQVVNEVLLLLVKKDVIEDKQYFAALGSRSYCSMWSQYEISIGRRQ